MPEARYPGPASPDDDPKKPSAHATPAPTIAGRDAANEYRESVPVRRIAFGNPFLTLSPFDRNQKTEKATREEIGPGPKIDVRHP